ncbi:saccharopine dehydrogenase, partial [Ancylostoma ceylanicum]
AGLSSSSLIRYVLKQAETYDWTVRITDQNSDIAAAKINGNPRGVALSFNALDPVQRRPEIERADLVISMLPARFHVEVAKDCIDLKTNLITPSYVSKEMKALHEDAQKAGITIMNEIGVDPGIDHMSAMKIIDEIKGKGGKLEGFKSFCGGLMAPESDTNPWNYKFTWNPRNVVLAGSGGAASFIRNGRGTLRRPGFCEAWSVFVELGMTDDTYTMVGMEACSPRVFLNAFLPYHPVKSIEDKFKEFLREDRMYLYPKFEWLGLFDEEINLKTATPTPAQLLQIILERKWKLEENDKDMLEGISSGWIAKLLPKRYYTPK